MEVEPTVDTKWAVSSRSVIFQFKWTEPEKTLTIKAKERFFGPLTLEEAINLWQSLKDLLVRDGLMNLADSAKETSEPSEILPIEDGRPLGIRVFTTVKLLNVQNQNVTLTLGDIADLCEALGMIIQKAQGVEE